MSNPSHQRGNGLADSPQEELVLIHAGLIALGLIAGSAGALWLKGATWLVEHHILVPGAAGPILTIPGTAGAGLDLPRLAIAAAVVLAGIAVLVSSLCRIVRRRRYEDLT